MAKAFWKALVALGTSIGNNKISLPAANAANSISPGGAKAAAPFILRASVIISPSYPHWSLKISWITLRERLVGFPDGSREGIFKWAIIMAPTPASIAPLNGTHSTSMSSLSVRSTFGNVLWLSWWVSPWPGKCFPHASTPLSWIPLTTSTPSTFTRSGSEPKDRAPIIGLFGFVLTSSTGEKLMCTPTAVHSSAKACPKS